MADFRLGRLKFNWTGDWTPATAYVIDDIVKFGANTYVCISNHTSVVSEADYYTTDGARWSLHTEGIFNRNDWATSQFYRLNDIVKYGNDQYRTVTAHTSGATFNSANFVSYVNGLKFEDSWDGATEYQSGDIVVYGGYTYVATSTTTDVQPNINLGSGWEILTTGFKVVGNWDLNITYKPGDVVLLGGNSYVAKATNTGSQPSQANNNWDFVVGGFTWKGAWDGATAYNPGDAVTHQSNSYICILASTNDDPVTDTLGTYWNSLAQGAQTNVLTDPGDVLYIGGSGASRLPVGNKGEVLTVDSGYPAWKKSNFTQKVYYVTPDGNDTNTGENITQAFASIRHACDNITGPGTLYVKAGTYLETLPIVVPEYISIVGDNMRTSMVKPDAGNASSTIEVSLAQVPASNLIVRGENVTTGDGSKTGILWDVKAGGTVLVIQPVTGGIWTTSDTFEAGATDIAITGVVAINNEHSTMFYMSNKTMMKDLVLDGMAGFVPSGSDPKDLDTATIKGVFLRLNPNSKAIKSPYISQCSCFSSDGVGAIVDGSVHDKFDGDAEPSNKTMLFDSFSQIHNDGGVGFWVTGNSYAEIVSCFTYYAHISYCATNGGQIRSLAGNSSWGVYGVVSQGYNTTETTSNGWIDGLELNYDVATLLNGDFSTGEVITGGTSGAKGEILSYQPTADKILYRPLKGTFVANEVVTGADTNADVTLVNNSDACKGVDGFTLVLGGMSAAPDPGGSIEFVTGPGNLGEDLFSYVIANSSYTPPSGLGELTVTRAQLGSTGAAHDGLSTIARYQAAGATTLANAITSDTATQIFVASITGLNTGGYIIIDNEMMQIDGFGGNPGEINVTRGVEGTTAVVHAANQTVTAIQLKVAAETETRRDLDASENIILVLSAAAVVANDYIKIDDEFFKVTQSTTLTTGTTTVVLADQKAADSYDRQVTKIRYFYSQVRLTGHDFLNVGTGTKTTTNFPGLPTQDPAPGNEVIETMPGRVFYVSTDQSGNFRVGKYFRVNQATGSTTLNASSFDLSGLSSLRLGSIGAQIGESISEFSSDITLSANSNSKCPTQKAVKAYVDTKTRTKGFTFWAGSM